MGRANKSLRCAQRAYPSAAYMRIARRYASAAAQRADWKGHKEECKALGGKYCPVPPATIRLAARILWRRQREQSAPANESALGDWDSYGAIQSLDCHWTERSEENIKELAQIATLVRCLVYDRPCWLLDGQNLRHPTTQ